jgi:ubiquinol-cytochrome c reductase iron-sulfur subunit
MPATLAPQPRGERKAIALLVVSTVAALALAGVYVSGGQAQAEGALLGVALVGLGMALIFWARGLRTEGTVVAERGELGSTDEEEQDLRRSLDHSELPVGRRAVLRLFWAAGAALGLAALFPIRSLGPAPGRDLQTTAWRPGRRLVDGEGRPLRSDTLQVGSTVTAFPEGATRAGDAQVVVVRVEPDRLKPREGRETWAPQGYVAYSKICPHVGCPVALYQADTHELLCPCHQSTFDVLDGARPRFGPATRALPQLPLAVDAGGFLVAQSDFHEPVGPGFWNRD